MTQRRRKPFWWQPEWEDQELVKTAGHLSWAFSCALLLIVGRPLLALCGMGLILFKIWWLLKDTVEPAPTYGILRLISEGMGQILILSLVLLALLLLLPALLLATAFPGLLWFIGALSLTGSAVRVLVRSGQRLGGAHLITAGLGIALACLLRSPLPLASAAIFLGVLAGSWTRLSRQDLRAFVTRLRPRRSSPLDELDAVEQGAVGSSDEVYSAVDEPPSPRAFTFSLSAWVACHLEGRTAEDLATLQQELSEPLPEDRLPLCRRILAHAVQFQEGSFVRELVQNVLDEAARVRVGPWRRVLAIDCRGVGDHLLEIEVADFLGMSFGTLINDLLVPNRTSKSARDWGTIGRFGQGFFTTLREAERVRVQSFLRTPAGGGWDLEAFLAPVWNDGTLQDVTVSLSAVWRSDPSHKEGTVVTWRGRRDGDNFVAKAWEDVKDILQNIPADELFIRLNGRRVNQESSNYALIPTLLGPLRLSVQETDRKDLLITKNHLPLTIISRQNFTDLILEIPERFIEFLFAGGVVLDLPPGLPLNRTRNTIAARERFADSLTRDVVRACLLADIEFALRSGTWPADLRRDGVISRDPSDWQPFRTKKFIARRKNGKREKEYDPFLWENPFFPASSLPKSLGEHAAAGTASLKDLRKSSRSSLLLALPCIPNRLDSRRWSLSQIAGASLASLLCYTLPLPSLPIQTALSSSAPQSLLSRLARFTRWAYKSVCCFTFAAFALLVLALPFRFLGQQVGLWALFIFLIYFLIRQAIALASKLLPGMATPIGEVMPGAARLSVWDALGSIARDGASLLLRKPSEIPVVRPQCRLYHRPSEVSAFAPQGGGLNGQISWNAHLMKKSWDIRHLQKYLRNQGSGQAAERLRPWLEKFLLLLTHESVHLIEEKKAATHEELFYRRQRRLLEKALCREDDFVKLFEREASRPVHWTWSPARIFLIRRNAERREWNWSEEP